MSKSQITLVDEHFSFKFGFWNETQLVFTCSKSTMKTPEQSVKSVQNSGLFIVNFEQILLIVLVFPLLTLNK